MAEEFQASNWWKTSKSSAGFHHGGSSPEEESNISCSTTTTDVKGASFPWPGDSTPSPIESGGFAVSSPTTDWSQTLLRASSSRRAESSIQFQAMLQENLISSRPAFSPSIDAGGESSMPAANHHPFFFNNSALPCVGAFPLIPTPSSSSSSMLQFLFDPDTRNQQSLFNCQQIVNNYQHSQLINHLQFTNNTPFWNASSSSSQPFDLIMKNTKEGREKENRTEPPMKRPRIEPPSSLTTFKVRKEKLGDRITALQQLVSPFGKTDTASVLHEAIECIKFLHDQVSVLSTPYLKNGQPMQQHQQSTNQLVDREVQNQNLRSRGLCLVPISSTYPMASETTADYWTPTFGGTYR
ncbi:Transcription factor bHLH112 [Platanthera zijinensis]|uniref:Transcription factor bHLH112 n=1 Tax=Platanthera zijinensis TaxID=2320716 RepID=A0AAP0G9I5_9ASPA